MQLLHASEVAFWENLAEQIAGHPDLAALDIAQVDHGIADRRVGALRVGDRAGELVLAALVHQQSGVTAVVQQHVRAGRIRCPPVVGRVEGIHLFSGGASQLRGHLHADLPAGKEATPARHHRTDRRHGANRRDRLRPAQDRDVEITGRRVRYRGDQGNSNEQATHDGLLMRRGFALRATVIMND